MNVTATRFSTQARTWVLIAGLSALLVAIGGRFLGGAGYLLFGGISVVFVFVSYWYSDRFAIRSAHAQPISEADDPRLYAIVRDLAQRAKVPMPRVYLIPSEQPNAFATGRNPKHAAVAVTVGLRKYLPEDQIRAVLAHEFAHIKNRDILVSSIAAMIASAISAIANILQFGMIFGGGSDNRDSPLGGLGRARDGDHRADRGDDPAAGRLAPARVPRRRHRRRPDRRQQAAGRRARDARARRRGDPHAGHAGDGDPVHRQSAAPSRRGGACSRRTRRWRSASAASARCAWPRSNRAPRCTHTAGLARMTGWRPGLCSVYRYQKASAAIT